MDNLIPEELTKVLKSLGLSTFVPSDELSKDKADAVKEALDEWLKKSGLDKYLGLI